MIGEMGRRQFIWVLVAVIVASTAYGFVQFFSQAPIVRLHPLADKSIWTSCPDAFSNSQGDTMATCVLNGDTAVELSLALLHTSQEGDISLSPEPFDEEMYRTYYHGGIRNKVSVSVAAIDNDDTPALQLYASHIDEIERSQGLRAFNFEGQRLEFANADGDLLFALRFQHNRIGSLIFKNEGGSLRAQVVL